MDAQPIRQLLDQLYAERGELEQAMEANSHSIAAAEHVLELMEPPRIFEMTITHGKTVASDISGASTYLEAAVIMAQANKGVLRVTDASKLINAAGISDAKVASIAATLHNRLSTHDDWEYVEPGTFKWISTQFTNTYGAAHDRAKMLAWFRQYFEDPVHSVPHESAEGGYQWGTAGPYFAFEVLTDQFGDTVDERHILQVANELDQECSEWSARY